MRRELIQAFAVFAIAVGAGLFAFGRHLDPPFDPTNPATIQQALNQDRAMHSVASIACGIGVGFMTLGILSLAIPWINAALALPRERVGAAHT